MIILCCVYLIYVCSGVANFGKESDNRELNCNFIEMYTPPHCSAYIFKKDIPYSSLNSVIFKFFEN